jgi:hypothetical protein
VLAAARAPSVHADRLYGSDGLRGFLDRIGVVEDRMVQPGVDRDRLLVVRLCAGKADDVADDGIE